MALPEETLLEHLTDKFAVAIVAHDADEREQRYAALEAGNPLPFLEYERTFPAALRHRQALVVKFTDFLGLYLRCSADERATMINLLECAHEHLAKHDAQFK